MRDERLIKVLTCIGGAVLALVLVVTAVIVGTQPPARPEITRSPAAIDHTIWPCLNEDGSGQPADRFPCYWLGGENGLGQDLIYLGPDTKPIPVATQSLAGVIK